MEETEKPKKGAREITARNRLNYINIRLTELSAERAKLVEERKALTAQRRSERGMTPKQA